MCSCALIVSLAASLAPPAPPADRTKKALTPARIAALVRQLGDDRFETREAASRALEQAGEPALGALQRGASSKDPEVRRRAAAVHLAILRAVHAREFARLHGEWVVTGAEQGGKRVAATLGAGNLVGQVVRFKGGRAGAGLYNPFIDQMQKVTLVDVRNGSGKVDFWGGGVTYRCLYKVEGDQLLVAWPLGSLHNAGQARGQDRWDSFRPGALRSRSGDCFHLLTLERPKPLPEPPAPARAPARPIPGFPTAFAVGVAPPPPMLVPVKP